MRNLLLGTIKGEEPPKIAKKCLQFLKYLTNPNEPESSKTRSQKYIIRGDEGYYNYVLSNPGKNKTSGDFEILDINNKLVQFIEYTKCRFGASGNNVQFQRMTKFVPYINTNIKSTYFIDNVGETKKLTPRDKNSIRCMKTIGINLIITDENIKNEADQLNPYYTINELIKDWNGGRSKSNIRVKGSRVYISKINVLKPVNKIKKLRSDPEIGKLLCVILTILRLRLCSITIIESGVTNQHFSQDNKLFRSLNHIQKIYNNIIYFQNTNISYKNCIPYELRCFTKKSTSESVVSIAYEELLNKDNINVLYTNHARCEQSYLMFNGEHSIPKTVKKPDIIYKKDNDIFLVEAEKLENLKNGIKQIKSWTTHKKTKLYYDTIFKGYNIHSYIILYADKFDKTQFEKEEYNRVKCVIDNKSKWYKNF
jgi:hypothetical protein